MDSEQNAAAAAETNEKATDRPASAGETSADELERVATDAIRAMGVCSKCGGAWGQLHDQGLKCFGARRVENVALSSDQLREPGGLHKCKSCGVELDGDDPNPECGDCWAAADDEPSEPAPAADLGTYVAMFAEYRREQRHWIGPAQQPLVFHMQKLCQKLDANPDAPASLSSAYLQAFRRLDLQRPGDTQPAGAAGDLPGQGSIFDELD